MDEPTVAAPPRRHTTGEELVHAATHGVGALLSLATLVFLVAAAAIHGPLYVGAVGIFCASLTFVYLSSTIYHSVPATQTRAKAIFQIVDHVAIHLLIAGTFTPFALCAIGGAWGWSLFAVVWSVAALGTIVETTALRRSTRLSIAVYLAAGWAGILATPLLWSVLPPGALGLLVLGGVAYTAGVPFFLAHGTRWMHALWHAFVLAGSAFHVAAIALVVTC